MTEAPTLPLTRNERLEMNSLSKQAYGVSSRWHTILQKGELRETAEMTKNGKPITVKKLHYLTLQEIYNNMVKILADREAAAKAQETKAD